MAEPLDVSKKHFYRSMAKSVIRLGACLVAAGTGSLVLFALLFAVAEFIGILEEL